MKYSKQQSTVKYCTFSKLQCFQCTSTVISLHIFAVYSEKYEIARSEFKIGMPLGDGNYGIVKEGCAWDIRNSRDKTKVAIKTLKDPLEGCPPDKTKINVLWCEIKVLDKLDKHPNLVNMVAACTKNPQKGEIWLLLEFCPHGDLRQLLNKYRSAFVESLQNNSPINCFDGFDAAKLLIKWPHEIAKGMEYLSSKNVMHGDLAARNILIGGREGNFIAKIADFGLSKTFYDKNYKYKRERAVPFKYMDIDFLTSGELKLTSDIWSFGVVLWEIFSLGEEPYGHKDDSVIIAEIIGGKRLKCPKEVSEVRDLRNLFHDITPWCWQKDHSLRSDFPKIVEHFTNFMTRDEIEESRSIEEEFNLNVSTVDATKERANSKKPQNYLVEISLIPLKIAKNLWARMKCWATDFLSTEDNSRNQCSQGNFKSYWIKHLGDVLKLCERRKVDILSI
jgi:serine/threonine protein kinase